MGFPILFCLAQILADVLIGPLPVGQSVLEELNLLNWGWIPKQGIILGHTRAPVPENTTTPQSSQHFPSK